MKSVLYLLCIAVLIASIYILVDLLLPENWIPTVQWMRDWSELFLLPTCIMMGLKADRLMMNFQEEAEQEFQPKENHE